MTTMTLREARKKFPTGAKVTVEYYAPVSKTTKSESKLASTPLSKTSGGWTATRSMRGSKSFAPSVGPMPTVHGYRWIVSPWGSRMRRFKVGQRVTNPLTGRDVTIIKVVRTPPGTLGGSWIEYFDYVSNCPRVVTFREFEDAETPEKSIQ